jgi:xylan 1,4-beta-xylosidase
MADTIRQCDGLVDEMSYWSFSDVFEEQGVVKTPFYGGYGLIAAGGIPKPAFAAFTVLHQLGNERLALDSDSALVTRAKDGSLVVAVWNIFVPEKTGTARTVTLRFKNTSKRHAIISRVDRDHGDPHPAYEQMGSPVYPTQAQLEKLRASVVLAAPEKQDLKAGELTLTLPPDGLAVIAIK